MPKKKTNPIRYHLNMVGLKDLSDESFADTYNAMTTKS